MTKIPLVIDLVISFAIQFIIFYFIMLRLNNALGIGRFQGALVLATIFTGFHALYSRATGKHVFYQGN
jgi:hypothetical protein